MGSKVGCFIGFIHLSKENLPIERSCLHRKDIARTIVRIELLGVKLK